VKQQPFNPGLDYTAWHSLISSIFVLYSKKIKKSRSIQVPHLFFFFFFFFTSSNVAVRAIVRMGW
jgi:hypothetical protein